MSLVTTLGLISSIIMSFSNTKVLPNTFSNDYFIEYHKERVAEKIEFSTPNGNTINASIHPENTLSDFQIERDIELNEKTYPGAELLDEGTDQYNCFSYAFIAPSKNNIYGFTVVHDLLINSEDYGYELISYNDVKPGDKIVYKTSNSQYTHAGVIESVISPLTSNSAKENLSKLSIISKWSIQGLYKHRGDECPYYNDAYSITFYRPYSNHKIHNYDNVLLYYDGKYHEEFCSCTKSIKVGHMVPAGSFEDNDTAECLICGGIATEGVYVR